MSHFTVLVIGEDHAKQLQPFHEFECTGTDDEFVQDVDVTADCVEYGTDSETGEFDLETALSYHGLEDQIVDDESKVDREGNHKYGYAVVQDGKLVKAVNRTNPNRKWDWWQVGGRWTGFLKLKEIHLLDTETVVFNEFGLSNGEVLQLINRYRVDPELVKKALAKMHEKGDEILAIVEKYSKPIYPEHAVGEPGLMTEEAKTGYCDQARKRDIDFNGMREEAAARAAEEYDKFEAATKGIEMPTKAWKELLEEIGDVEKAREIFNSHPIHQALRDAEIFCWGCPVEQYKILDGGREAFIEERRLRAIETFAVLKDGKWYERGDMGWWCCVSDEKDPTEWNREFSKMLDELPDDTLLTVVDCHI